MRTPKDWGQPCPNPTCTHYRRMQQGNVSAIATYLTHSGKRRIFRCRTCETPFSETRETVFFDLRTSEEKIMMALKMLLVRVDLAGIGFVLGVTEATVLAWLRRAAHPDLIYGQLVKQKKHGKLRTLSTRVVLGAGRLTHVGLAISTALVERVNLTLRQALAPLGRKTSSFCKDRERLRQRVVFFQAFYNVGRPHMSLRRQLPLHDRIRHGAICPRWQECTPAMAAGLTDHVWTFRELLTAKFEPLEFQSIRQ